MRCYEVRKFRDERALNGVTIIHFRAETSTAKEMTYQSTWGPSIVVAVVDKRRVFVGHRIGCRLEAWNNSRIGWAFWVVASGLERGDDAARGSASPGKSEALTPFLDRVAIEFLWTHFPSQSFFRTCESSLPPKNCLASTAKTNIPTVTAM